MNDREKQAFELLKNARDRAFAPYSNFLVGAVVKLKDDPNLYTGFNIENDSYPACICAERVAVFKGISETTIPADKVEIEEVFLISSGATYLAPCGFCLQVLNQFATPETQYKIYSDNGLEKVLGHKDLLPEGFSL